MRKMMLLIAVACLMVCSLLLPALAAENIPDAPLREGLLSTKSSLRECEFYAAGYAILGSERKDDTLHVYLAASVCGYGFEGGMFVNKSGWGGPCTVILQQQGGEWTLREVLEIEDYNELDRIMPKAYQEKFFARTDGSDVAMQLEEQAQAYLTSIGRSEPIGDWGDVDAPLSGMLVCASNLRGAVDSDYPLRVTTMECLEDGQRYLYTRAWQPDADGVVDPVFETEHGRISEKGTTGVETLTRVRKADGAVLETIVITVELERLTIDMRDENGSAQYVFPYDGWEYHQPAITREGRCGIDTTRLDRDCLDMPGETKTTWQTEGQADVSATERMTLLRDGSRHVLVYEQLREGLWQETWRADKLLPVTDMAMYMSFSSNDSPTLYEYPRFTAMKGDNLSIYAGEEHPELDVEISRTAESGWQVDLYNWNPGEQHAYVFSDFLIVNAADLTALQTAGLYFMPVEQSPEKFDPSMIWQARQALISACVGSPSQDGSACTEYFAGAEPLYMALQRDVHYPVYVAPDASAPRAAKGKAAVSLNSWVVALCREDNWLLVLYETSSGKYRAGWIDAGQDPRLAQAAGVTETARWEKRDAVVAKKTVLYDDPINHTGTISTLAKDTPVTVLWEDGWGSYVEVTLKGVRWRGFVASGKIK